MTLGKLLSQGGWAMWPIYGCSIIALLIFFQRFFFFWSVRKKHLPWLPKLLEFIKQKNMNAALKLTASIRHPVARILGVAIFTSSHRPDRVAAEAERVGMQELDRYENYLPFLGFIAQLAPLLGLLGTVAGMVQMFYGLQNSGMTNVNASALSSGIWKALLTTAGGLIVAAPTLAAHLYLSRKLEALRLQMKDAIEQLLTALPQHAPHQRQHVVHKSPTDVLKEPAGIMEKSYPQPLPIDNDKESSSGIGYA